MAITKINLKFPQKPKNYVAEFCVSHKISQELNTLNDLAKNVKFHNIIFYSVLM